MNENQKQVLIDSISKDIRDYSGGFFVTLDALTNDSIKFESQVKILMHWANEFCYGRSYKRGTKRLRIIGMPENGGSRNRLHGHWLLLHGNDMARTYYQVNFLIRRKWYGLLNAGGSVFGNLVDVQKANDIKSRIDYISKTFYTQEDFNPQYF